MPHCIQSQSVFNNLMHLIPICIQYLVASNPELYSMPHCIQSQSVFNNLMHLIPICFQYLVASNPELHVFNVSLHPIPSCSQYFVASGVTLYPVPCINNAMLYLMPCRTRCLASSVLFYPMPYGSIIPCCMLYHIVFNTMSPVPCMYVYCMHN